MAHFQRVPFDLLPPEQQQELIEKQNRSKKQREMLLQQMEEKKKFEKEPKKTKSVDASYIPEPIQKHEMSSYEPNIGYPDNFVIPPLQPLSISLPQQKPLLSERARIAQKSIISSTCSPTKIKDTFTNLRHQIRNTAANATIGGSTVPLSPRNAYYSFGENLF